MEKIDHTATKDSPEIVFEIESNTIQILGNSFPENCDEIYEPVKRFLEQYDTNNTKVLNFSLHFNLINSTSTVYMAQIICKVADLSKQGVPVNIKWHYYEYDEEMMDLGEKLSSISDLPIEYVAVQD